MENTVRLEHFNSKLNIVVSISYLNIESFPLFKFYIFNK